MQACMPLFCTVGASVSLDYSFSFTIIFQFSPDSAFPCSSWQQPVLGPPHAYSVEHIWRWIDNDVSGPNQAFPAHSHSMFCGLAGLSRGFLCHLIQFTTRWWLWQWLSAPSVHLGGLTWTQGLVECKSAIYWSCITFELNIKKAGAWYYELWC